MIYLTFGYLISIMIGLCILYSRSHGPIRLAGSDVSVNSDLVHVILGPCETFWMHFVHVALILKVKIISYQFRFS